MISGNCEYFFVSRNKFTTIWGFGHIYWRLKKNLWNQLFFVKLINEAILKNFLIFFEDFIPVLPQVSISKEQAYSEHCQTSKIQLFFSEKVNGFQLLTNFAKWSILNVSQGSQYTSERYFVILPTSNLLEIIFWRRLS